jgi:protein-disulfide isomerase
MRMGLIAGVFGLVAMATGPAAAQEAGTAQPARELSSFEQELMAPGPMAEMTLGDPSAPVTVVEYASMTCGHCAHFHETSWPVLKAEYIETGKVYFVMREFPLDPLAAAGFMLARKAPGGRYFDVVDVLFERQKDWAYSNDPVTALRDLAKQFGYSPKTFDEALSDQKLLDDINAVRTKASETFKVDSTPTFFINGEQVKGAMTPEDMKARLDAAIAAAG